MLMFSGFARNPLRVLGAVAALLMSSILAGHRAEALSPINHGMPKARAAANELTIEVRGGHGGGGGGGGGGHGGFSGFSGHSFAPAGFSRGVVRGGAGAGSAIVAAPTVAGTPRFSGHVAPGPGFAGHHRFHRRHVHGVFIGGVYYDDYPYDYPDYYVEPEYPPAYAVPDFVGGAGCRRVLTVHGPRVFCHHRAARHHRIHRRHYHRRHHRA